MEYSVKKSADGLIKIISQNFISVIIPTKGEKHAVCVSCQIGCPVRCKFCRSRSIKFRRNLSAEEIVNQVEIAKNIIEKTPTSIIFMGIGEPTLNLKNVLEAAEEIHRKFSISYNRITISTSGFPNIKNLEKVPFNVAVSLHSPFDKIRKNLIPNTISIRKILNFSNKYCDFHHKKSYVMIEYSLIKDVNDSEKDLRKLLSYKWHKRTLFNLIEFNDYENFKGSPEERILRFKEEIIKAGFKCFIRKSRGQDIGASCGMLEF